MIASFFFLSLSLFFTCETRTIEVEKLLLGGLKCLFLFFDEEGKKGEF